MNIKTLLYLLCLFFVLWFMACESPVSTEIKSGDMSRTEFAVYTSADRIYDPAWSPDGERIAFVSQSRATDIFKMSAAGDTMGLVNRFYTRIEHSYCAISPDEQYVIYRNSYDNSSTSRYNRYLYSVAQDTSLLINDILSRNASLVKWSRDSRSIYYRIPGSSSYIINAMSPEGAPVFSVTLDSTAYIYDYSIAPDKQCIVWSGRPQNSNFYQLWRYTPTNGQQKLLAADSTSYRNTSWSPDGSSIAYVSYDFKTFKQSLNIFSVTNNSSRSVTDSIQIDHNSQIVWSDDGQTIYFTGYLKNDPYIRGIWVVSLLGNSISLNCLYNPDHIFHLNADGFFYIIDDFQIFWLKTFSVADKKITSLMSDTRDNVTHPAWSSDGASLVFSKDRKLCSVPATGGEPESLNIDYPRYQYNPDYSPDGSLLVFDDGDELYTVSANGGSAIKIRSIYYNLTNPVWSPDGTQIACSYHANDKYSLSVFNYDAGTMIRAEAWSGRCTDISWSKPHPVLGAHLLFAKAIYPGNSGGGYELKALNVKTDKLLSLIGYRGSLSRKSQSYIGACWASDAETIAWIQRDYPTYSLNIARILVDLQ